MLTGNKGEWSEIYAFFKILAEGKLYPGDANLNKIAGFFYPVISVLKNELSKEKTFSLSGTDIIISDGKSPLIRIPVTQFASHALSLLANIKSSSSSFSVASTETFLKSLGLYTLKANSSTKADIVIQIHDSRTNFQPILGFSIKSKLGSPSTLLNASTATNLNFKIKGISLSTSEVNVINSINTSSKIRDRVQTIYKKGASLEFVDTDNKTFYNNLVLIDSLLPIIVSEALIAYYKDHIVTLSALCTYLTNTNPVGFDQSLKHKFYEHKLKRFLSEVALGMMPNTTWTGEYDGTEGYIVIKEDGEVVCYHIINRNLFEDYLLANTRIDTPSSARHGYGLIYNTNGDNFLKLNFQIRFI
ncbi:HpaII family restriction endonuclease [Mucilaginibacter terrigena]|uniref:HpaII family restriction endonuclease n=1 Tax=Mucilaginibacter terrigena TaxID=2492395 RepID=A0A4Q5LN09_9SPHI|nr:HpaII family restriction endonuclease [Mucilaginibacter terrigena]RYU89516.1 HpaII family restriction endonuclease [Mucilaginibacter terrigena]